MKPGTVQPRAPYQTDPCCPAHAIAALADLREITTNLASVVSALDRYLHREHAAARLAAVEGLFAGDTADAVAATHLWLSQARTTADTLHTTLEQAHIAAGGLARKPH
ncbi:MAG: hypothetical protein ACRDMV_18310 [Streptosporangiales bacterium]